MTKAEAEAALERCEKATEGPWYPHGQYVSVRRSIELDLYYVDELGQKEMQQPFQAVPFALSKDAELVAHARTDLPAALDLAERLVQFLYDNMPVVEFAELEKAKCGTASDRAAIGSRYGMPFDALHEGWTLLREWEGAQKGGEHG